LQKIVQLKKGKDVTDVDKKGILLAPAQIPQKKMIELVIFVRKPVISSKIVLTRKKKSATNVEDWVI